jgi:hypothetical protein
MSSPRIGFVLSLLGSTLSGYTFWALPLGSLRQPGSGMFPLLVGVCMVAIGLLLTQRQQVHEAPVRASAFPWRVALGMAAFAPLVGILGYGPACFTLGWLVARQTRSGILESVLAGTLTVTIVALVFDWGMDVTGPMVHWDVAGTRDAR